jgi:hypothetical protein
MSGCISSNSCCMLHNICYFQVHTDYLELLQARVAFPQEKMQLIYDAVPNPYRFVCKVRD